jgi:hypothetical protein
MENPLNSPDTSKKRIRFALGVIVSLLSTASAQEKADNGDDTAELAKKLSNPIASLISLPLQYNFDHNMGPGDKGSKSLLNIQPVIPISLNQDWNVISRTIVPLVDMQDMAYGDKSGMGDVLQSLFFSPKAPTANGVIWGVGPALLFPTASDDVLGGKQWGAGPTAVALKQTGPWTFGVLVNHIWSYAGENDREDVNATFVQPFVSHLFKKTYTTIGLNTETSCDWDGGTWTVPVNLTVSQMLKIAGRPFQLVVGPRYWLESPEGGPEGVGLRAGVTLLFPK